MKSVCFTLGADQAITSGPLREVEGAAELLNTASDLDALLCSVRCMERVFSKVIYLESDLIIWNFFAII